MKTSEYRVRPVTRYVVTEYKSEDDGNGRASGGCSIIGEFPNQHYAEKVAESMRFEAETRIPSAHQIGDMVELTFSGKAAMSGCRVEAVRFEPGKVRYDVRIDMNTVLPNVASENVTPAVEPCQHIADAR